MRRPRRGIPWWWSVPARSGSRRRSTWRSAASPVVLLDDDDRLSTGSRAICFAKRTLEVFDRLGCGEPMARKGVGWNTGRVFLRDEQLYSFDLLAEAGHQRPAFVNLQQYYVEGFLLDRARRCPASRSAGSTGWPDLARTRTA